MTDAYIFEDDNVTSFAFHQDEKWYFGQCRDALTIPKITGGVVIKENIKDWLASQGRKIQNFRPFPRGVGDFHPRIWRPGNCPTWMLAGGEYKESVSIGGETTLRRSAVAAEVLVNQLSGLFRTVEPIPENSHVYGHEIRNVLLLACMEVESALTGVLRANSYVKHDNRGNPIDRWNTTDYVKLLGPLRLRSFAVSMVHYPEYPTIFPFASWDAGSPTKSLRWYDAYNSTKHDREQNFGEATLEFAIEAVAAVLCLIFAQFGPGNEHLSGWGKNLWQDFNVLSSNTRITAEDYYAHWNPVIGTWNPVNAVL